MKPYLITIDHSRSRFGWEESWIVWATSPDDARQKAKDFDDIYWEEPYIKIDAIDITKPFKVRDTSD